MAIMAKKCLFAFGLVAVFAAPAMGIGVRKACLANLFSCLFRPMLCLLFRSFSA
jgi:hypothetical protein